MMFSRLKYFFSLLGLSFITLCTDLHAQIKEVAINHQDIQVSHLANRMAIETDTISLPLWDDFSIVKNTKAINIWQNLELVNINNGLAHLPPSYNVASLDGFDAMGMAYSNTSSLLGIGDSLVSKPIDLSGYSSANNINLSFFWQEGFGPTAPDSEDSLRVYFKNVDSNWVYMTAFGGNGRSEPISFQQFFLSVANESFFHAGFQFKFEYFGNLAGDFDIWNLDYIYLNEGNNRVTTTDFRYDSYEDRTFSTLKEGIFSGYSGVPLQHLDASFLDEIIQAGSLIYNNLWAGNGSSSIFGTEIFGSLFDTLNPTLLIDSITVNGNFLTRAQDTALFSIETREKQNLIDYLLLAKESRDSAYLSLQFNLGNTDSLFFETINGTTTYYPFYSFKQNDTLSSITSFHDFYALDDGTAESGIQLNSKSYELAQYFPINGDHFLTAVDMYIPNLAQNSSTQNITLLVLDNLSSNGGSGNVIYAQNVLVTPAEKLNGFHRFEFDTPVPVSNEIYIGYREENDAVLSVGFDKNSNSATELYYNQSGTWQRNESIQGSIMMRPVFGKIEDILSTKTATIQSPLMVYPNPSQGTIKFNLPYDKLTIFGADGRLYYQASGKGEVQKDTPIDLSHLNNGLYMVQIYYRGNHYSARFILRK